MPDRATNIKNIVKEKLFLHHFLEKDTTNKIFFSVFRTYPQKGSKTCIQREF